MAPQNYTNPGQPFPPFSDSLVQAVSLLLHALCERFEDELLDQRALPGQRDAKLDAEGVHNGADDEELGARGATKSGRKRALQLRLRALIIRAAGS